MKRSPTVLRPAANDEAPRLTGYVRGYRVAVWCKYCQVYHWHGLPRPGDTHHRMAHCHDMASPYEALGYYLEPLVEMSESVWRDAQLKRPRGPKAMSLGEHQSHFCQSNHPPRLWGTVVSCGSQSRP